MSAAETEETQSAFGDGGGGLPGAPTPLSVLEVHKQAIRAFLSPLIACRV